MRYLSVCSGIEAATLAWAHLGWSAAAYAEIDRFPSRVLAQRFGSSLPGEPLSHNAPPNLGDFTGIDVRSIAPVDLLAGGTPCQSFSVAGRRLSLEDARGNLSLAYTVLAHALAETSGLRWAVWENVPGVLSTDDNAFGCFLGALVGADDPVPLPIGAERWPDAGMVAGPRARAAWRVLDAQYFGLAQRRRRVFVVAGFGDGADPATVLFEPKGLRGHPPARGEAGQDLAGTLAGGARGRGGYSADDIPVIGFRQKNSTVDPMPDLSPAVDAGGGGGIGGGLSVAYGGNNTAGPIDVATAVNAHGGPHGRQDFESETFVVAPPLTSNPYGDHESREGLLVAFDCKAGGKTGLAIGDIPGALRGEGFGGGHAAVAFDTTQITNPNNRCNPQPGDPCHPVTAAGHPPAIAFQGCGSNLHVGEDIAATLSTNCDRASGGAPCLATGWAVRRLTPRECERLQGMPDDWTAIDGAADGPRYKAIGNSMAVPVMRWIGERIAAQEAA